MQVAPSEPYGQLEFDDSVSTYLVILLIEDDEMRELFGLGVVYGFEKGGYVLPFCEEVEVGEGTGGFDPSFRRRADKMLAVE